jgi:hypothetical protein
MPALFPGEIATVKDDGRLKIPSDIMKSVSWWTGETVRVYAELTYRGLVRIYPCTAVQKKLDADASEELASEAQFIARATMADRYRQVSLYNDCRLRFTKDICPWLGFWLGDEVPLYVQAFPNGLEIMSVEHRFERLIAAKENVFPWTFKALD